MMDSFPVFIHTRGRKIVFVGGAEDIGHKLILLRGCRNMNGLRRQRMPCQAISNGFYMVDSSN